MFTVDEFGKITISLGGVCSLGCKHCYITSKDFRHQPDLQIAEVVETVAQFKELRCICVSGDTDPLLRPEESVSLMEQLARLYPKVPVTFTTRLVPSKAVYEKILALAAECSHRRQLFIPCVSLVTFSYPNRIENAQRVPPSSERLKLVADFVTVGIPCIVALRPTFSFSLVPEAETTSLVKSLPHGVAAVLGEVFLVDKSRQLPMRLGWKGFEGYIVTSAPMTFISQPSAWDKCYLSKEVEFVRSACHAQGLPYFLRSMSAFSYLQAHWSFEEGCIKHSKVDMFEDKISICP
ncbi:MAG: radical SAM protein [Acidobacteriia bacterium]|nr:radical SAM protein [Terriglobia bacterium]